MEAAVVMPFELARVQFAVADSRLCLRGVFLRIQHFFEL